MPLATTLNLNLENALCLRLNLRLRMVLALGNGALEKHNLWLNDTKTLEEVIVIKDVKHTDDCAVQEDGPCTCGTEEVLEELALEDADLPDEDFA